MCCRTCGDSEVVGNFTLRWAAAYRSRSRSVSRDRHRDEGHSNNRSHRQDGHDRARRRTPSPDRRGGGRMRSDSLQDHASSAGAEGTGQRRSRRSTSRSRSRSRDRGRDRDRDRDRGREDSRDRGRARNGRESARAREERERADRSRYAGMTGAQIEREKAKKRLEELSRLRKDDYEEWKEKLRTLDLSRTRIKEAMGFAFDKIESADEVGVSCAVQRCKGVTHSVLLCSGGATQIVSMVKDKLILPSSYAAVKIAGLYLLSDILHNTGAAVKHASTYR
jgi:hypothetical protein